LKKYLLSILFTLSCGFTALAGHIAGGELTYTYLGGNNYQVTLKLYRNCGACPSGRCAQYDTVAYVYVFDSLGNQYSVLSLPFPASGSTIVPSSVTNPCMDTTSLNVCIEQAIYTTTVSLPPIAGGYSLVYQRCCRNLTIASLVSNSGSTYLAHIPTSANAAGTSPSFISEPPLFICVDQYLQFNNSASNPNGDSLSYSLVDAMDGASFACPNPSPASGCAAYPPPYSSVVYQSPYSATNPLNNPSNSGNLTIDPSTGLLSGIPNQVGSFVVAVAVSEYRNGVYIGQTIRDYQFNIITCDIPKVNINYQPGTYNTSTGLGIYSFECSSDTVHYDSLHVHFYNPSGISATTYHWDFGLPNRTDDTSNLKFPTFYYPDTGTYLVTVITSVLKIGGGWCYDTARGYVVVYPKLHAAYGYVDVCRDSALTFIDSSYSTTSPINLWHWDFGDGDTTQIHSPTHTFARQGTYHVEIIVQNQKGCKDSASYNITPHELPLANFTVSSACVFDSVHIQYTGTGTVADYYWDFGNGTQSTVQNPVTIYDTAGTKNIMLVTVTPQGCRDTILKPVVIHPLPVIGLSPVSKICPFTSTQLSASGGTTYHWSPGNTLSDSTISNPIASPGATPTFYYVTVTDAFGCTNRDLIYIDMYPLPQINAGPDTSVCLNPGSFRDSVQLNATGGVTYVWTPTTGLSNPNIANPLCRPVNNQIYYVLGTDTNGCKLSDSVSVYYLNPSLNLIVDSAKSICDLDTTQLNVLKQGNSAYFWTPNVGISDPNSNSPYFYPQSTTTYTFTVQNYCYTKSDTATIVVHPLPPLTTEHVDSVCQRDSVTLHASGADTYHWTRDITLSDTSSASPMVWPSVTDIYYVTGTDTVYKCKAKDTVLVHVFPLPTPAVGPDTAYICQGTSIILRASGGVDYVWQSDPTLGPLTGANPIATPTDTDEYYVRVYNIHRCHADDSIHINVQLPVHAITKTPYDFCEGSIIQLEASGGFYYHWTPARWLTNPDIANPHAKPDSSITYTVTVSNDCFSDAAQVVMTVRSLPMVYAGRDTTIYRNTEATLNGTTDGISYYWYPGQDVASPFTLTTAAEPLYTSSYYLFAKSQYGCINVDTIVITVEPYTILLMPTAFSPNGDGLNDVFHIARSLNISHLVELAVYNRWGEKVYSSTNITDSWDGTYRGQALDMGTYTWMLKAVTYDGETITRSGNVTLIR